MARELGAARVVLAVPVGPARTLRNFADADQVVCVSAVSRFLAVGYHYADFSATRGLRSIREKNHAKPTGGNGLSCW